MDLTQKQIASERARDRIRRQGCTAQGYPLWTEEEDDLCRKLHHDRKALKKALKRRTMPAIENRCMRLGLRVKHLHWWTAAEISKLRRMYPTATWEELLAAFPGLSCHGITQAALKRNIRRARKPYKPTGDMLIDQLKGRCFELGVTVAALEAAVGQKGFLAGYTKSSPKRADLGKALSVLDGQLTVAWQ